MKICALCNGEAAIYCSSDSAFLCLICDAKVHEANFLVSRHVRDIICSHCNGFTEDRISGMGFQFYGHRMCLSCSPVTPTSGGDLDCLSSSSSSACVSTTQSSSSSSAVTSRRKTCYRRRLSSTTAGIRKVQTKAWRVDSKAEGILVNWCTQLGLVNGDSADVVRMACEALGVCLDELTILPFRVSLVASLWFGIRFCMIREMSTWQGIKRLEEISGVPAKVIASAESKLERLFKAANKQQQQQQQQQQRHSHELLEEGWAES